MATHNPAWIRTPVGIPSRLVSQGVTATAPNDTAEAKAEDIHTSSERLTRRSTAQTQGGRKEEGRKGSRLQRREDRARVRDRAETEDDRERAEKTWPSEIPCGRENGRDELRTLSQTSTEGADDKEGSKDRLRRHEDWTPMLSWLSFLHSQLRTASEQGERVGIRREKKEGSAWSESSWLKQSATTTERLGFLTARIGPENSRHGDK
ncbi:hypothetical protein FB451DRAFT_1440766 [Mycena latifolia]|nr:hypothetical protein FB451DRAFT_1440766 [Mycena latifolia]